MFWCPSAQPHFIGDKQDQLCQQVNNNILFIYLFFEKSSPELLCLADWPSPPPPDYYYTANSLKQWESSQSLNNTRNDREPGPAQRAYRICQSCKHYHNSRLSSVNLLISSWNGARDVTSSLQMNQPASGINIPKIAVVMMEPNTTSDIKSRQDILCEIEKRARHTLVSAKYNEHTTSAPVEILWPWKCRGNLRPVQKSEHSFLRSQKGRLCSTHLLLQTLQNLFSWSVKKNYWILEMLLWSEHICLYLYTELDREKSKYCFF